MPLDLKSPLDMRKISDWKMNLSSPELNHFQVKNPSLSDPKESTNGIKTKSSLVNLWKADVNTSSSLAETKKTNPSKLLNLPSAAELKLKLLKENARLKDKFFSKRSPLHSSIQDGKSVPLIDADHSSNYGSIPEVVEEPIRPTLNRNYSSLNSKSIQDWVKNQQSQTLKPELQSKRKSVKNLFDESMDPSSVIYMASVAAAAATSAGLSSVRQKVSFVESEDEVQKVYPTLSRRKRTPKSMELGREDSGIGCVTTTSTQSHSEGDIIAHHSDPQLLHSLGIFHLF